MPKEIEPKKHYPRLKSCNDCSIKSKEIYYSYKFQKNLCLDCLRDNLLKNLESKNN